MEYDCIYNSRNLKSHIDVEQPDEDDDIIYNSRNLKSHIDRIRIIHGSGRSTIVEI